MSKEKKGCLDYVEDYKYLGVGAKNLHRINYHFSTFR